ncbi:MAG: hypothetical protein LGR52_07420, partial [Candidatus Thiosymbion ectosymbiont of Robbea hypermnestra]|nr:hypothetical protein [Candidatus Thiosymbion ectosymbiont of Robbea hypermnestra]
FLEGPASLQMSQVGALHKNSSVSCWAGIANFHGLPHVFIGENLRNPRIQASRITKLQHYPMSGMF